MFLGNFYGSPGFGTTLGVVLIVVGLVTVAAGVFILLVEKGVH